MRRYRFLWLILAAYVAYMLWPQLRSAAGMAADVGSPVPTFTVQDLHGRRFASHDLAGQVVLVNFWATWCPPCRAEMPDFDQVYRQLHSQGFEILAIALDPDDVDRVTQFSARLQLSFPVIAEHARLARAFGGTRAVPTSFLIDRSGHIRAKVVGEYAPERLRTDVKRLLHEGDTGLSTSR